MASRHAPRRPPPGSVPITPARWRVLCELVEQDPDCKELYYGDRRVGWRAPPRLWHAEPDAYREIVGTWPPGYWPG